MRQFNYYCYWRGKILSLFYSSLSIANIIIIIRIAATILQGSKFKKRKTRHWLYVFIKKKVQLTRQNASQQRAHMTCFVHSQGHGVLTVPLTVLLYLPIWSMTHTLSYYTFQFEAWRTHCPISAEIGLVIANYVRIFLEFWLILLSIKGKITER